MPSSAKRTRLAPPDRTLTACLASSFGTSNSRQLILDILDWTIRTLLRLRGDTHGVIVYGLASIEKGLAARLSAD